MNKWITQRIRSTEKKSHLYDRWMDDGLSSRINWFSRFGRRGEGVKGGRRIERFVTGHRTHFDAQKRRNDAGDDDDDEHRYHAHHKIRHRHANIFGVLHSIACKSQGNSLLVQFTTIISTCRFQSSTCWLVVSLPTQRC